MWPCPWNSDQNRTKTLSGGWRGETKTVQIWYFVFSLPQLLDLLSVADPGFPREGHNPKGGGTNLLFGPTPPPARKLHKMKETGPGKSCPWFPPLDPPLAIESYDSCLNRMNAIRPWNIDFCLLNF